MNKKYLLAAFLAVTNICVFAMDRNQNSGWDSDEEQKRSVEETHLIIQEHIKNSNLGAATRETSQLLHAIEENPHSPDMLQSLAVVETVQGELLSLASFQGKRSSPIFRDLPQRVNALKNAIRYPSTSPVNQASPNNLDEDIANHQ